MKKSIGILLCAIIIILLIVIAVGSVMFVRKKHEHDQEVVFLSNHIMTLTEKLYSNDDEADVDEKESLDNNTSENSVTSNENIIKLDSIIGKYELKTNNSEDALYISKDGTFGYFTDFGGYTGSYSFDGEKIVLNPIFVYHTDTCLQLEKKSAIANIKEDGSIEINAKEFISPESPGGIMNFKKVSNNTEEFDIRQNIKENIGSGPEYYFILDY